MTYHKRQLSDKIRILILLESTTYLGTTGVGLEREPVCHWLDTQGVA